MISREKLLTTMRDGAVSLLEEDLDDITREMINEIKNNAEAELSEKQENK